MEKYKICITGKLEKFANRDELVKILESLGHDFVDSVSTKTDLLVNNDLESNSKKNRKAKELNIPIVSEDELIKRLNLDSSRETVVETSVIVEQNHAPKVEIVDNKIQLTKEDKQISELTVYVEESSAEDIKLVQEDLNSNSIEKDKILQTISICDLDDFDIIYEVIKSSSDAIKSDSSFMSTVINKVDNDNKVKILELCDTNLKNNYDFVEENLAESSLISFFENNLQSFIDDRDLVLRFLQKIDRRDSAYNICLSIIKKYDNDYEIIKSILEIYESLYKNIPDIFKNDYELIKEVIKKNKFLYTIIPENYRDLDITIIALDWESYRYWEIYRSDYIIEKIPNDILNNKKIIEIILKEKTLKKEVYVRIDKSTFEDESIKKLAMKNNSELLKYFYPGNKYSNLDIQLARRKVQELSRKGYSLSSDQREIEDLILTYKDYAPGLIADKSLAQKAVKKMTEFIKIVSPEIRNLKDFAESALKNDADSYKYLGEKIKNDEIYVKDLILNQGFPIPYLELAENIQKDVIVSMKAIDYSREDKVIDKIVSLHGDNYEVMIDLCKKSTKYLKKIKIEFRNDKNFIKTVFGNIRYFSKYDLDLFDFVGKNLKCEKELMLYLQQKLDVALLKICCNKLKDDYDFVYTMIDKYPSNYSSASNRIKSDRRLAEKAVIDDYRNFQFVDQKLKNDKIFIEKMIDNNIRKEHGTLGFIFVEMSTELKNDKLFIEKTLDKYYQHIGSIDEYSLRLIYSQLSTELKNDKKFVKKILEKNINGFYLIPPFMMKDQEFLSVAKKFLEKPYDKLEVNDPIELFEAFYVSGCKFPNSEYMPKIFEYSEDKAAILLKGMDNLEISNKTDFLKEYVLKDNSKIVSILLERNFLQPSYVAKLIEVAMNLKKNKVLPILLAYTKDVKTDKSFSIADSNNDFNQMLKSAIKLNDYNKAEEAILFGANPKTIDKDLIMTALKFGNIPIVKLLLENGMHPNGSRTIDESPLHLAVELGNLELVNLFIKKKANINAVSYRLKTPLGLATKDKKLDIIMTFIKIKDKISDFNKSLTLESAVLSGDLEIVKLIYNTFQPFEFTARALAIAAYKGEVEIFDFLTDQNINFNYKIIGKMDKYKCVVVNRHSSNKPAVFSTYIIAERHRYCAAYFPSVRRAPEQTRLKILNIALKKEILYEQEKNLILSLALIEDQLKIAQLLIDNDAKITESYGYTHLYTMKKSNDYGSHKGYEMAQKLLAENDPLPIYDFSLSDNNFQLGSNSSSEFISNNYQKTKVIGHFARVKFPSNHSYEYITKLEIKVGDQVFVEGKLSNIKGVVVSIGQAIYEGSEFYFEGDTIYKQIIKIV